MVSFSNDKQQAVATSANQNTSQPCLGPPLSFLILHQIKKRCFLFANNVLPVDTNSQEIRHLMGHLKEDNNGRENRLSTRQHFTAGQYLKQSPNFLYYYNNHNKFFFCAQTAINFSATTWSKYHLKSSLLNVHYLSKAACSCFYILTWTKCTCLLTITTEVNLLLIKTHKNMSTDILEITYIKTEQGKCLAGRISS